MNTIKLYGDIDKVEEIMIKMNILEEYDKSQFPFRHLGPLPLSNNRKPIQGLDTIRLDEGSLKEFFGVSVLRCVLVNLDNNKYIYTNFDINEDTYDLYRKKLED